MRMATRTGTRTRGCLGEHRAPPPIAPHAPLLCGRWNTDSNETTWSKPQKIVAKKGIAAGYLSKVQKSTSSPDAIGSSVVHEDFGTLQRAKSVGVSGLAQQFSGMTTSAPKRATAPQSPIAPGEQSPVSPSGVQSDTPPEYKSGKTALSVEALRKYQEAKAQMANAKAAPSQPAAGAESARSSRRSRADAPPQVDLYK